MHSSQKMEKSVAILLILALSTFSVISTPARAAMVDTGDIFKQNQHDLSRTRINMFLDRSEVRKHLVAIQDRPSAGRGVVI